MPLIESLPDNLNKINIPNSIIFSDMTGTLLYQTEDGSRFPTETRNLIAKYIDLGGIFVLVTGDSFQVAKKQFINYLPLINNPFFVLTESGAEIHKIAADNADRLYKAEPLSFECKKQSLEICIQHIDSTYNISCNEIIINSKYKSIEQFLMGGRLLIDQVTELTNKPFFLEVADYKVTIYAEAGTISESPTDILLSKLRKHPQLESIAKNNNSILMRGAIYFEIIANSKEQGINKFLQTAPQYLTHLKDPKVTTDVIVLGDSPNDEGMYLYPYEEVFKSNYQTSIFLGVEEEFIQNIIKNKRYLSCIFHRLSGAHESGSLEFFKQILG